MDAETILDEFADAILNRESAKQRGDIIDPLKRNRECYSELLPLIRAGLALQRLETFIRCQHYKDVTIKSNSKTRFNVLVDDYHDNSMWSMAVGDKPTLADAINAALDAAGEGT